MGTLVRQASMQKGLLITYNSCECCVTGVDWNPDSDQMNSYKL